MAGKVLYIKVCNPLKLRSDLKGKCHSTCHYSYNLRFVFNEKTNPNPQLNKKVRIFEGNI